MPSWNRMKNRGAEQARHSQGGHLGCEVAWAGRETIRVPARWCARRTCSSGRRARVRPPRPMCGRSSARCARRGARLQITRQQVGRVGFEQQAARPECAAAARQVRAAPLIADPAGDADRQPEFQIGLEFRCARREAVRDATASAGACSRSSAREVLRARRAGAGIHGLPLSAASCSCHSKARVALPAGEIAVVVESAFARPRPLPRRAAMRAGCGSCSASNYAA